MHYCGPVVATLSLVDDHINNLCRVVRIGWLVTGS